MVSGMKTGRLFLLTSIITALVIVIVVVAIHPWQTLDEIKSEADIGGPFTLVDQDGKPVTEAILDGHLNVIYFGYTYCPDVCPTTLQDITAALDMMGDDAKEVQPILITVDPERDTPEVLKEYVGWFYPTMIGLTGTPEEIEAAKQAYKVYSAKAPQEDDETGENYLVDHSSIVYVMGPDGQFITHFAHGTTPEEMAKKLEELI
jgi:protein SCO1/2